MLLREQILECTSGTRALRLWADHKEQFGRKEYDTLCCKLRVLFRRPDRQRHDDGLLQSCLKDVCAAVATKRLNFAAEELARIVHCLAVLRFRDESVLALLESDRECIVRGLDAVGLSSLAWSLAQLQMRVDGLLKSIDEQAFFVIAFGKPREIASILWSFAKLNFPGEYTIDALNRNARDFALSASPRDISNVFWALATLEQQPPALMTQSEDKLSKVVEEGNPQDISNAAWAMATRGRRAADFFQVIDTHAAFLVEECSKQELCNLFWAASVSSCGYAKNLCEGIENPSACSKFLQGSMPIDVCTLVRALVKMHRRPYTFLSAIESDPSIAIPRQMRDGHSDGQTVSNIVWVFAHLEICCPHLAAAVANMARQFVEVAEPRHVAIVGWGLATLSVDWEGDEYFEAVCWSRRCRERMVREGRERDVAQLLWAITIHGAWSETIESAFLFFWTCLMDRGAQALLPENRRQTAQMLFVLSAERPDFASRLVREAADKGWDLQCLQTFDAKIPNESATQVRISKLLLSMGWEHERRVNPFRGKKKELKVKIEEGGGISKEQDEKGQSKAPANPFELSLASCLFSIDLADLKSRRGVEITGPVHFLETAGGGSTDVWIGSTRCKDRVLRALGWRIVHVSGWADSGEVEPLAIEVREEGALPVEGLEEGEIPEESAIFDESFTSDEAREQTRQMQKLLAERLKTIDIHLPCE
uniref:Uncharacterized protein n=1 Tax=Chromera velia CCMP2878 TaxID=1169474 RepID=A0A0G4FGI7_9ALVE|eukprot:Cvel_16871.t1-p1 / transcript=Cvel_16871.t1 / gene=Cvel_16871 / organism=Chromera_velia_CCMP2878 / gene_product=hypothetical protein / transcript_product=hypothetical protein / location=Cvel_scaffold1320:4213-6333(+) / protein_length=707 / sequence_SO=supercontig / SO=protein_coding / is_pseudo=false